MADRGGFEPPRPFKIRSAEFSASLVRSAQKKASALERTSFALAFGSASDLHGSLLRA